jgi:RNA ligase (TIGR02306 family)
MTERKLATVRVIAEVKDIPEADKIQAYRVDGWWVVDAKGKYKVGDMVVYCEPDSWVPHEIAPFLSKGKEPKVYEGVKGERLRIQKLKNQISQGLLLDIGVLWTYTK